MAEVEVLFGLADEAVKKNLTEKGSTIEPPNFPLPRSLPNPNDFMELRETSDNTEKREEGQQRGWHARQALSEAGTLLLVSKPFAMVLNDEVDEYELSLDADEIDVQNEDEMETETGGTGSISNGLLILKLAKAISQNKKLWTMNLKGLFPRSDDENLPEWHCLNDTLEQSVHSILTSMEEKDGDLKGIRRRLPWIVRYNALSVETSPELFQYPNPNAGGHISLSGTALYNEPSFFNHSPTPNVNRWAIGDISVFVTNRSVALGEELCISYLEHELLCENGYRRTILLGMDFIDEEAKDEVKEDGRGCSKSEDDEDDDDCIGPKIDDEVQQELMNMLPIDRLDSIQELLDQATGNGDDDNDVENDKPSKDQSDDANPLKSSAVGDWFQCDIYRLRILRALTYDGLGKHDDALTEWETCINFVDTHFPPYDENAIALRVQAALCLWSQSQLEKDDSSSSSGSREDNKRINSMHKAHKYATEASKFHDIAFGGGGIKLFQKRYQRELELPLRPKWSSPSKCKTMATLVWNELWTQ